MAVLWTQGVPAFLSKARTEDRPGIRQNRPPGGFGLLWQLIFGQNMSMADELWRPSFDLALHRNRPSPQVRYVQLATVRENHRPAVRTVVFRGFLGETHHLTFATDGRSEKVAELEQSPWAEVCWYFPVTREQFRFLGTVTTVGTDVNDPVLSEARVEVWREMSEESRLSYTWPDPSQPRLASAAFPSVAPDPLEPLPHFCLLVLEVREVDHLELHGSPQHRWKYSKDAHGRWSGVEVNP